MLKVINEILILRNFELDHKTEDAIIVYYFFLGIICNLSLYMGAKNVIKL
jgi:hypothetical protein